VDGETYINGEMEHVRKKATAEILLIEKAEEKSNQQLEKEIFDDLSEYPVKILWMERVLKVTVEEV